MERSDAQVSGADYKTLMEAGMDNKDSAFWTLVICGMIMCSILLLQVHTHKGRQL